MKFILLLLFIHHTAYSQDNVTAEAFVEDLYQDLHINELIITDLKHIFKEDKLLKDEIKELEEKMEKKENEQGIEELESIRNRTARVEQRLNQIQQRNDLNLNFLSKMIEDNRTAEEMNKDTLNYLNNRTKLLYDDRLDDEIDKDASYYLNNGTKILEDNRTVDEIYEDASNYLDKRLQVLTYNDYAYSDCEFCDNGNGGNYGCSFYGKDAQQGVLLSGGADGDNLLRNVEIWTPQNGSCTLPSLNVARAYHTQSGLRTCGGEVDNVHNQRICETFVNGSWKMWNMKYSREGSEAWTTPGGDFIVLGGCCSIPRYNTTEVLNIDTMGIYTMKEGFSLKYETR